ncbi:MAG: hypothetical protein M1831_001250 [Alyxoria varia]|nr:MAG: hypothetical protein M1831_001250 [Alyxoria varia]
MQPAPAEHIPSPTVPSAHSRQPSKSHSRHTSKGSKTDNSLPSRAADSSKQPSRPVSKLGRGKATSLSFPVLASSTEPSSAEAPASPSKASESLAKNLRIAVPQPNDSSFLTTLAAQERHVLELREELQIAETELTKLKKQWVTHEARKRQSESRRVHHMQHIASSAPRNARSGSDGGVNSLYTEMERRKANRGTARPARMRRFSGSRHTRDLSLVSPETLQKMIAAFDGKNERSEVPEETTTGVITASPADMRPSADLDKHAFDPPTRAETSVTSDPQSFQRRKAVRSSVQIATDFREGLWTFFEDLKHATYGDEPRSIPTSNPETRHDANLMPSHREESPAGSTRSGDSPSRMSKRPVKQLISRHTWEFRPQDYDADVQEMLVDGGDSYWKSQSQDEPKEAPLAQHSVDQEVEESEEKETSEKPMEVGKRREAEKYLSKPLPPIPLQKNIQGTPQSSRKSDLHTRVVDGQSWETWDTPRKGRPPTRSNTTSSDSTSATSQNATSPSTEGSDSTHASSTGSSSSTDVTIRPSPAVDTGKKRSSIQWPALEKFRPSQLTRTASSLMDEWEKSLNLPESPKQEPRGQREGNSHTRSRRASKAMTYEA